MLFFSADEDGWLHRGCLWESHWLGTAQVRGCDIIIHMLPLSALNSEIHRRSNNYCNSSAVMSTCDISRSLPNCNVIRKYPNSIGDSHRHLGPLQFAVYMHSWKSIHRLPRGPGTPDKELGFWSRTSTRAHRANAWRVRLWGSLPLGLILGASSSLQASCGFSIWQPRGKRDAKLLIPPSA